MLVILHVRKYYHHVDICIRMELQNPQNEPTNKTVYLFLDRFHPNPPPTLYIPPRPHSLPPVIAFLLLLPSSSSLAAAIAPTFSSSSPSPMCWRPATGGGGTTRPATRLDLFRTRSSFLVQFQEGKRDRAETELRCYVLRRRRRRKCPKPSFSFGRI